jgi:hypothetical protein
MYSWSKRSSTVRKADFQRRTVQISQLEQKLDGLVSILTNSGLAHDEISVNAAQSLAGMAQAPGSTVSSDARMSFPDTRASISCLAPGRSKAPPEDIVADQTVVGYAFGRVENQPVTLHDPPIPGHTSSSQTPEELLGIFRQYLARQVPFIALSLDMTALELEEERPFLYRSLIMAASFNDASHQMVLGDAILKSFADAFLVQGIKTLDLLQGLLVFLSW